MSILQQHIAVVGAVHGLLMFILLITDRRVAQPSRILGVICLVLALFFCLPLILAYAPDRPGLFAIGWLFYLPASLGGLVYLYCRNALLDRRLSPVDLVHLAPLFLCLLLVADHIFIEPEAIAQWIKGQPAKTWRIALSEYLIFAQALVYFPLTVRMILTYRDRARSTLANFNPGIFNWLLLFTSAITVAWILKAVFALSNTPHPYAFSVAADLVFVVLIYAIAAAQWRHPQLFTIEQLGQDEQPATTTQSAQLDPSTQNELFETVRAAVEGQSLFRDPGLTLSSLAKATGLSTHHLSEVLNKHAGKNFYEFINGYRVEFVCNAFREARPGKILDIALDAGFASKSTFNAIFKQHTGQTPSQYRKGLAVSDV